MYNNQKNPPITNKFTTRSLGYGIVFGTVFGVLLGAKTSYQIAWIIGAIVFCMLIGYFLGKKIDQDVNEQLRNFAYAVKSSSYNKDKDSYEVTIVDKKDQEKTIEVNAKAYKEMSLKKYDLVYLKKNGKITPAFSKTREKNQSKMEDMAKGYETFKDVRKERKNKKED